MNFNIIFDAFSYKILLKTCFFPHVKRLLAGEARQWWPGSPQVPGSPGRGQGIRASGWTPASIISPSRAYFNFNFELQCFLKEKQYLHIVLYWDQIQFCKLKRGVFVSCVLCICLFRVYLCPSGITLNQESCTDKTQYNRMDNWIYSRDFPKGATGITQIGLGIGWIFSTMNTMILPSRDLYSLLQTSETHSGL